MIKKSFIIFTFALMIFFNVSKVQAKETSNLEATSIIETMEEYGCKVEVIPTTKFKIDDLYKDYYSITYEVITENCELTSCFIPWTGGLPYEAILTDTETTEDKREFDDKFKIMLPKEVANDEFGARVEVIISFTLENEEVIHTIDKFIYLDSRKSSLEIDVEDSENHKKIEGVELEVENCEFYINEEYTSNENGKILVDRIGKGQTKLKVVKVPEEYNLPEIQYTDIAYDKDEKYTIKIEHKKGSFSIETMQNATFEIYNEEGELVGEYSTDENGNIENEKINIGKYILKQTKAAEGYEKIRDMNIEIEENKTWQIAIVNTKLQENPNDEAETGKDNITEKPKEETQDKEETKLPENNIQESKTEIKEEADKSNKEQEDKTDKEGKKAGEDNIVDSGEGLEENISAEENKTANSTLPSTQIKQNQSDTKKKLPRTGNDYFEIKLIIFDLAVFAIAMLIVCLKKKKDRPHTQSADR